MAIRFYCKQCGQLLGIASRKAGTQIECPKCGCPQTVPAEEVAAAAVAMTKSAKAREQGVASAQAAVYEDETSVLGVPAHRGSPLSPAVPPPLPDAAPPGARGLVRPMPSGTILYQRRTIYVHAFLFLLLGVGAFAAGYFVGRGDATGALRLARGKSSNERVLAEGKLYYEAGTGSIAADSGAVIIALPAGRLPEATLSIQQLRPRDPPPAVTSESIRKIEALGGAYARADDSGTFRIVLPEEGKYRLLLISRQTTRAPGAKIARLDLSEITQYFYRAEDLIGPHKYHWTTEQITPDSPLIERNFGRDGQE